MTPVLEVAGISKRFGAVQALSAATLTIRPGEFVAVLGPSGSGKTTLFRCITRLTEPDAGEIWVAGRPLHGVSGKALTRARRDIGVVFQQFNLIRRRTANENVLAGRLGSAPLWRVITGLFPQEDQARSIAALEAVGLSGQLNQRADTLSGGQQQRVAIARALAQESKILLADEPVASLDPETAESILSLMRALTRAEGLAVLCTLHQPQLAARFADRIISMRAGHLVDQPS